MTFNYACFISYPHLPDNNVMKNFINGLKACLKDKLGFYLRQDVYVDTDRLHYGWHYNEALASAICQSFCLIVVYSPVYNEHLYCLREYRAMKILEEERKRMLHGKAYPKRGMIYLIALNGIQTIPDEIKEDIHCCDFARFTLTGYENLPSKEDFVREIDAIAQDIYEHYQTFKELNYDCASFSLPTEDEAKSCWGSTKKRSIAFPGRDIL